MIIKINIIVFHRGAFHYLKKNANRILQILNVFAIQFKGLNNRIVIIAVKILIWAASIVKPKNDLIYRVDFKLYKEVVRNRDLMQTIPFVMNSKCSFSFYSKN